MGNIKRGSLITGYLQLFLTLEIINLAIIAINLFRSTGGLFLMLSYSGAIGAYSLMYLCLSTAEIVLTTLVIFFFFKRKKIFINIYIASTVLIIVNSILAMTLFAPLFANAEDFFNVAMTIIKIVLNIIMLCFWINFFKTSIVFKAYIRAGETGKKMSRKQARARRRFKVIK